MRTVSVVVNPEIEVITNVSVEGRYENHNPAVEVQKIVELGGRVLVDFDNLWVVFVKGSGIVLLDQNVPVWEPSHATCLAHCDWQYVDVTRVEYRLDDNIQSGLVFSFEDDVSSSPCTVLVSYRQ